MIRFGRDRQPSYAWSFDRGDGWANVGYGELLRPSRPGPTRRLMLQRLEQLLPGATEDAEDWAAHHLPLSSARWKQPDGRILLAGDAAALVNPLTGEGLYYAVATGAAAGAVAARSASATDRRQQWSSPGAEHRCRVRALLGPHLLTTATLGRLASLPPVVPAGLRAAAADQRLFDDLVEVGLGRGRVTGRMARGALTSLRV